MSTTMQRNFTGPEVDHAMESLALNAGNLAATERQLKLEGLPATVARLKRWARVEYPDKYRAARVKRAQDVKEFLADKHHAAAIRDLELEEQVTQRLTAKLEAGELKPEAELTLKGKAGLGSAIHTDKGQQLDGEQTPTVQVNITQNIANLANKGIRVVWPGEELEGEAEEIEDSAA
jgi:hypothetical protein